MRVIAFLQFATSTAELGGRAWQRVAVLAVIAGRPGLDEHRACRPHTQHDTFGHLGDPHPHRQALRQANPFEGGRDAGQKLEARAAILLRDAPVDAFDPTDHGLVRIRHQRDDRPIAGLHAIDVVLSEVAGRSSSC